MTRLRTLAANSGLAAASMLLTLLLIELALRYLPVNTGLAWQPVNAAHPVQHFEPNRPFIWSLGWDFSVVNQGRTNNAGFINDNDYQAQAPGPLLAVIGDSYIQAEMVPFAETVPGRLAQNGHRVYSFGASGAPLSQYLIWAQAVLNYGAKYLVITIVGNDFDESLLRYKSAPGHHYYAPDATGELKLTRIDYAPSSLRRLLRKSALARYLLMNIHIEGLTLPGPDTYAKLTAWGHDLVQAAAPVRETPAPLPAPLSAAAAPPAPEPATMPIPVNHQDAAPDTAKTTTPIYGNTTADSSRLTDSRLAVDAFLRDLPRMTGLAPDHILLVMDGLRYPAQAQGAQDSYFVTMRTYLLRQASVQGFETIDLDEWFFPDFLTHQRLFHVPGDGHWNGYGHGLAAQAIRASRVFTRFAATAQSRP